MAEKEFCIHMKIRVKADNLQDALTLIDSYVNNHPAVTETEIGDDFSEENAEIDESIMEEVKCDLCGEVANIDLSQLWTYEEINNAGKLGLDLEGEYTCPYCNKEIILLVTIQYDKYRDFCNLEVSTYKQDEE